jgi:DNA-binding NtrC family response regulator
VIGTDDLPDYVSGRSCLTPDGFGQAATLEEIERVAILRALRQVNGNRARAAERLDISTRTIRNKLKKYNEEGLMPEEFS